MIRLSNDPLRLVLGALGAATVIGLASVLSQAPASATSPVAHRAASPAQPMVAEPAPVSKALSEARAIASRAARLGSTAVPVKTVPGGQAAPPALDRCSATTGLGRVLPMCVPLAPPP
jgi:hypothetical protein